jgi:tetratricopeptide (TPR) repeat protein
MGRLFEAVGQYHEAAKCYGAEYGLDRSNREIGRLLGLALARSGESRRAIATLETVTRRWPNDGASWQALGFAYMAAKRTPQAEVALRRAVALGPDLSSEHRDLGALLASRGRDADARAEYRKAIALDAREPTVWVNLGNLERRGGHLAEAMRCYDQALDRDSTLGLAWQGRIGALLEAHREADAGAAYRRWLNAVPRDLDARLEAVRWFDHQGRRDIALELARDGVRRNPGAADAHLVLGMALESSGNTRSALAEFRRAEAMSAERGEKDRVRQLISALRAAAPDSLRAMFDADSAAHRR